MAAYRVTYWRAIPTQVEAFDASGRVRRALDARFQALVDAVAMREGLAGTDAYLAGWHVGPVLERQGTPQAVAEAVAAELEAQFDAIRAATRT
jgi:hypothetical protein